MSRSIATVAVLLLLSIDAFSQQAGTRRLRAGAHKVDVTPKETDLRIPTDSIRDHLFARAIVVDDGSMCAVLVGVDLGSAGNQIVDDAIPRASKATGCPAQNFIVSATHTHSSHTQGLGQGAPTAKSVADAIVEAASVAKSKLASARIGYGKTTVDLNVNRVLGDINFVTVNGEVYSEIGMRLKAEAPANRTLMVTLANGSANAGYIYADKAYSHLTFQVIGSRLKPGCAEGKIVATAIRLMRVAGQ